MGNLATIVLYLAIFWFDFVTQKTSFEKETNLEETNWSTFRFYFQLFYLAYSLSSLNGLLYAWTTIEWNDLTLSNTNAP